MGRLGKHKHRPLLRRFKQLDKEYVIVGPQSDGILGNAVRAYPKIRGLGLLVALRVGIMGQRKSDVASSKAAAVVLGGTQIQNRLRRLLHVRT